MAFSIDWATAPVPTITVPQSDLSPISGTLYEHDTEAFWKEIKALEASEEGIVFDDLQRRSPPVSVAGTTFAPVVSLAGKARVQYQDPAVFYNVKLVGTNNDIWSTEDGVFLPHSNVAVSPTNSAGLVIAETGVSGLTQQESDALLAIQADVDSIDTQVALINAANIEQELTDLNAAIAALNAVAIESRLDSIDTQVALINAANIESELNDLNVAISALNALDIEGELIALNLAIAALDAVLLEARLGNIEIDMSTLRKVITNKKITDPNTGILSVYDDDDSLLLTAQIYEDAAGTTPYKGQGLERQNKLI